MQPLTISASQIEEITPGNDEVIEGFGDVMIESKVNIGCEEILEDDDGERVDDDGYSMSELLDGAYFEYIECPITVSGVQNVT